MWEDSSQSTTVAQKAARKPNKNGQEIRVCFLATALNI